MHRVLNNISNGIEIPGILNKSIWPYQTRVKVDSVGSYNETEKWCREHLYHGGHYEPNWYRVGDTFCFKDEKEYLHFLLVWQ